MPSLGGSVKPIILDNDPDRETIGTVRISTDRVNDLVETDPEWLLDVALTPILIIAPGEKPRLDGWLLSRRTTLDTRPRENKHPYDHIDKEKK